MNSVEVALRTLARPRLEARPKIGPAARSFEMGGRLIVFIGGEVDGHRRAFEFFGGVFAGPIFRIELLDLIEMGGKAGAALFEIVGFIAHLEQLPVDQRQRRGELFGELDLLGNEGVFAAGEFFEFDFFALQLLALLLDALEFLLGVLKLAVVILGAAGVTGGGHLHLRRADFDVVSVFSGGGHE